MQKLSGSGKAFVEIDGEACEYTLAAGETMYIDTGYLAMMDSTVTMDIEMVKGSKEYYPWRRRTLQYKVTGPGRVWIQTMPIPTLANAIIPYIPTKN